MTSGCCIARSASILSAAFKVAVALPCEARINSASAWLARTPYSVSSASLAGKMQKESGARNVGGFANLLDGNRLETAA